MTATPWLIHEARRCGLPALALPLLAALAAAGAAAAGTGTAGGTLAARTLITGTLPVATALACASVLAREHLLELHLTLPTPYPRTVARRLAWLGTTALLGTTVLTAVAATTAQDPVRTALELLGTTLLLSGCALRLTARTGTAAPAAGLVVALALGKLLLVDHAVPDGPARAVPAAVLGALLITTSLRGLARHPSPLIRPGRTTGPDDRRTP
ncbi:hypothetical protein PUR71_26435 [Streptomyces sp. SP17BM10]|uniref:hypothetical protein n=1 Tax=Streptomyces sp. SP17BM10 TaxID=3002530 RepID=UPI002E785220|nr:hypothetical protein [Streptomyces sp. SP17BM10]MEE1786414.1 hypothetical protein [Streptomyces sp. SP17BM10]